MASHITAAPDHRPTFQEAASQLISRGRTAASSARLWMLILLAVTLEVALLARSLVSYAAHVAMHRVPALWRVHRVHQGSGQQVARPLFHRAGQFPHAEAAAQQTLALPIFPGVTEAQQAHVVQSVAEFYTS